MKIIAPILACFLAIECQGQPTLIGGTPGGASSLLSPTFYNATVVGTNSWIKYWGFPVVQTNSYGAIGNSYIAGGLSSSNELTDYPPIICSFQFTGSNFEVSAQNISYGNIQVQDSNGFTIPTLTTADTFGQLYPNSSPTWYLVKWSTAATRNVTLYINGAFAGVNVQAGDTVSANTMPPQRLLISFGDSYVQGYCPNTGVRWMQGYSMLLAHYVPNLICMPNSASGTGYANSYLTGTNYPNRAPLDLYPYATNAYSLASYSHIFVLITGTVNDNGYPTNTVYQDATNLYRGILSNCPNVSLGVIGPWYKTSSPDSDTIGRDTVITNACIQLGINYVSPVAQTWLNAGNVGTWLGSDSIHPSAVGYVGYANLINSNMINWYGNLWTESNIPTGGSIAANCNVSGVTFK